MKRYDREFLLSFADKECCKQRPEALDSSLWRDSPSPDIVEGGIKFAPRRDHPQEPLPEWRTRANGGGGGGGGILAQQRRKPFEEDAVAPLATRSWVDSNSLPRNQQRRELRGGRGEAESVSRPVGSRGPEHDGLLGSGNGLRGPGPANGGRTTSDRYNASGRGGRNNDTRFSKPYRDEDNVNVETFGDKDSDEHREEQERKRREAFETERREQQQQRLKEEKEKQKQLKISTLSQPEVHHETEPAPVAAPRPLVPPGFSQPAVVPPGFRVKKEPKDREQRTRVDESVDKPVVLERNGFVQDNNNSVDPLAIACSGLSISEAECTGGISTSPFHMVSPFQQRQPEPSGTSKLALLFDREDVSSMNQMKPRHDPPPPPPPPSATLYQGRMLPMPAAPSLEDVEKSMDFQEPRSARTFLTCEDIEQSLLANAESKAACSTLPVENRSDDDFSRMHFLSLLQRGANLRDEVPTPREATMVETPQDREAPTLLESLFGSSFMDELRSTDAPLSAKVAAETKYIDSLSLAPQNAQRGGATSGASVNVSKAEHTSGTEMAEAAAAPSGLDVKDFLKYKQSMQTRSKASDASYMDGMIIDPGAIKGGFADERMAVENGGYFRSHSPAAKPIPPQLLPLQGRPPMPYPAVPRGLQAPYFPGIGVAVSGNGMRPAGVPVNGRTQQQQQQQQYASQQQLLHHLQQQQQQAQQALQAHGPVPALVQYHAEVSIKVKQLQQQQHLGVQGSGYGAPFPSFMGFPGGEAGDRAASAAAAAAAQAAMMQPPQQHQQQRMFGMNKLGFP